MNRIRTLLHRSRDHVAELARDEAGDVPGWVLVTLMTAGIVVVLWAFAGPALVNLFEQALQSVTGL